MFKSSGILKYTENPYKLIVEIDQEISNYYFSLIPKYFYAQKQMYLPHISIIRDELPKNLSLWRKYDKESIYFKYSNVIYNNEIYFWLSVHSKRLESIRKELGLSRISEITKSPDGRHNFHITIANLKNNPH